MNASGSMQQTSVKTSPTVTPADPSLVQPDYSLETLAGAIHYNRWTYDLMRPYVGHRVLEFGAGIGNLTQHFLQEEREVLAIDIDERLIEELRKRVPPSSHLQVNCVDIRALVADQRFRHAFDTVVSSNVLEHVPDGTDLEVVRAMYIVLRNGGCAVHWVPACPAIYGSLDRAFGHRRRYDRKTATRLFADAGFEIVSCRYWNLPGFLSWWFSGRVLKMQAISRSSALAFDRLVVPVIRRIEPWLWRPFGQSLLVVAKKPNQ